MVFGGGQGRVLRISVLGGRGGANPGRPPDPATIARDLALRAPAEDIWMFTMAEEIGAALEAMGLIAKRTQSGPVPRTYLCITRERDLAAKQLSERLR